MTEPTPINKHRRYTKRQKATAVIAAEMSSISAAAEAHGIPRKTLAYWMDDPEIAELRQKTREDRAEAAATMSMLVMGEIRRRLPEFEPRDLSILYGIVTEKSQLLGGEATTRTEHRELADGLDDHEKAQLRAILDEVITANPSASEGSGVGSVLAGDGRASGSDR